MSFKTVKVGGMDRKIEIKEKCHSVMTSQKLWEGEARSLFPTFPKEKKNQGNKVELCK